MSVRNTLSILLIIMTFSLTALAENASPGPCPLPFEKLNACGEYAWVNGPNQGDESQLRLVLSDENGDALSLTGSVAMKVWMPHHGHGSSPTKVTEATDKNGQALIGEYLINEIYFVMPGHWDMIFSILDADGKELDSAKAMVKL